MWITISFKWKWDSSVTISKLILLFWWKMQWKNSASFSSLSLRFRKVWCIIWIVFGLYFNSFFTVRNKDVWEIWSLAKSHYADFGDCARRLGKQIRCLPWFLKPTKRLTKTCLFWTLLCYWNFAILSRMA